MNLQLFLQPLIICIHINILVNPYLLPNEYIMKSLNFISGSEKHLVKPYGLRRRRRRRFSLEMKKCWLSYSEAAMNSCF